MVNKQQIEKLIIHTIYASTIIGSISACLLMILPILVAFDKYLLNEIGSILFLTMTLPLAYAVFMMIIVFPIFYLNDKK